MKIARLLANYNRIGDAPDAIARFRRFILDLAVRGKLVPQDPADNSVLSVLRHQAVEGASDDAFAIPASWAWVTVGAVANARLGKMLDKGKNKGTPRPYLRNLNVRWFDFDLADLLEMPFEDEELSEFGLRAGDVMICEGGEPGRAAVWDDRATGIYFQKAIHRVRFSAIVDPAFFVNALRASAYDGRLADYLTGTGIKHFTGKGLGAYRFPLPPLAEQRRIVAKIDELMTLCDRLTMSRTRREATRDKLTAAILARLNAPAPETSEDDARFVLDVLPAITTRTDQITQVRQTILNLAVWGKLVPQDPRDEPASELLKQIAAEKAALLKAGEVRREKSRKPADSARLSFELRPGWAAATIRQILVELQTGPFGSSLHQSDYELGGIPVVNPASIQDGQIVPINKMAVGVSTLHRLSSFRLRAGDIVMGRRGEMGRCAIVTDREAGWLCGTGSLVLRLPKWLYAPFLALLIGSPYVRRYLSDSAVGATMQNLNQGILLDLCIAMPPLAEQRRIVAKVDELAALCDRLEVSIATSDDARRRLLEALLSEALNETEEAA